MKIVSGGQTGVDRTALDVALELGFPYGGLCPNGRRAEDGVIASKYPLEQTPLIEYRNGPNGARIQRRTSHRPDELPHPPGADTWLPVCPSSCRMAGQRLIRPPAQTTARTARPIIRGTLTHRLVPVLPAMSETPLTGITPHRIRHAPALHIATLDRNR